MHSLVSQVFDAVFVAAVTASISKIVLRFMLIQGSRVPHIEHQ